MNALNFDLVFEGTSRVEYSWFLLGTAQVYFRHSINNIITCFSHRENTKTGKYARMREENTFVARKKIKTSFVLSTSDICELVIKISSVRMCIVFCVSSNYL